MLAYRFDIVPLTIGTNDVGATDGISNAGIATLIDNLETMVRIALAPGALPVIVVPPAKNGACGEIDVVARLGQRTIASFYCRPVRAYQLPLGDMFRVTADAATGGIKPSPAPVGTHPHSATGIPLMATALADLGAYVSPVSLAVVSETTGERLPNAICNGSFAQQSALDTADGWTVDATNATSNATGDAMLPYSGEEFVYTKTAAGRAYSLCGGAIVARHLVTASNSPAVWRSRATRPRTGTA